MDSVSRSTSNTRNAKDESELETPDRDAHPVEILQTPLNASLSGQYRASYAYHTLRHRLPSILAHVKETMTREKAELVALFAPSDFEQAARDELNAIKSQVSGLKYDLQTDKPLRDFKVQLPDRDVWNKVIRSLPKEERTFYRGCCLNSECYFHRKLYSFVESSVFFKDYDFFGKIKEQALTGSMDEVLALAKKTRRSARSLDVFSELLKINMWSNCNDEAGEKEDTQLLNRKVLENVQATDDYVLVNDAPEIWCCLDNGNNPKKQAQVVDFVVDNAGYELFSDFILAEYLIEKGLATKVRFHVKAHPWFVTDVTEKDFRWTLEYLCQQEHYLVSLVGKKFVQFLDEGKFELAPISRFWTSPLPFCSMSRTDPELFGSLELSKLVLFKGELNYRKLVQDVCRESTQELGSCLKGFLPSNLCVLRRIKSELICGLAEGMAEELFCEDFHWVASGNYGVIQFIQGAREPGVSTSGQ